MPHIIVILRPWPDSVMVFAKVIVRYCTGYKETCALVARNRNHAIAFVGAVVNNATRK